jgi:hypothetical protein
MLFGIILLSTQDPFNIGVSASSNLSISLLTASAISLLFLHFYINHKMSLKIIQPRSEKIPMFSKNIIHNIPHQLKRN